LSWILRVVEESVPAIGKSSPMPTLSTPGTASKRAFNSGHEPLLIHALAVLLTGQPDAHGQQMLRIEAWLDGQQAREAAH
jgi:hypothetical protein